MYYFIKAYTLGMGTHPDTQSWWKKQKNWYTYIGHAFSQERYV